MGLLAKVKLLYLSLRQGSLIFKPNAVDMEDIKDPSEYGLAETSEVSIRTDDNEKIMLWVKQPEQKDGNMYVFFQGNTGHLGDVGGPTRKDEEPYDRDYRIKLLKEIIKNGDGFIAVSHRGYGKSTGTPSEIGFIKDIKEIAKFIEKEKNQNLVILGESLGSFSSLVMAEELLSRGVQVDSVNLIAPFSSIEDKVLDDHPELGKYNLPNWIDNELSNLEIIKRMPKHVNINIFHSKDDVTTYIKHSKKLLEAGKQKGLNIKFHDISPAGHITWSAKKVLSIINKKN